MIDILQYGVNMHALSAKSLYKHKHVLYCIVYCIVLCCRNILDAAFSVLSDRREVSAEKAKGNIFLH